MKSNGYHLVLTLVAGLCLHPGALSAQTGAAAQTEAAVRTGVIAGAVLLPPSRKKQRTFRGSLYRNRLAPDRSDPAVVVRRSPYDDIVISAHPIDFDPPMEATPTAARMDQKMAQFQPRVLPVRVGARVEFVNQDRFYHNGVSLSTGSKFDIGRKPTGVVVDRRFEVKGAVEVFCDIHPQMKATLLVLDTPWFAQPDSTGSFRLDGLPEGRYRLHAYHPEHDDLEREIVVESGVPVTQSFVFGR